MARVKLTLVVCQDEDDKEDKENQQGEGVYKRPIFTYGTAKKRIKEMNDENNVNVIIYWTVSWLVSWLHRKHSAFTPVIYSHSIS